MIKVSTCSVEQTCKIGEKLGSILGSGDIVCMIGELGTGKTALAQGIAKSLGIGGYVTSPTFTIVNEYTGKYPLYHFDVYRISNPEEMFEIGFEEYIYGGGIVLIEWADLVEEILPEERIQVDILKDAGRGLNVRDINITFKGDRYREYEKRFMETS
jgi:tRNA threonylcarbamoyladenosine biosynthesis protein TsaE